MELLNEIRIKVQVNAIKNGIYFGERLEDIELPHAEFNELIEMIIDDYQIDDSINFEDLSKFLLPGFNYMFDKGVEAAYNIRTTGDFEILYDFEELRNGFGGDNIPAHIQVKCNGIIGNLAATYYDSFEFINSHNLELTKRKVEIIRLMLGGGAFIGMEFALRMELD